MFTSTRSSRPGTRERTSTRVCGTRLPEIASDCARSPTRASTAGTSMASGSLGAFASTDSDRLQPPAVTRMATALKDARPRVNENDLRDMIGGSCGPRVVGCERVTLLGDERRANAGPQAGQCGLDDI